MARFFILSAAVFLLLCGSIETRSQTNFFHLANQAAAPGETVAFTLNGHFPANLWIQWYHWGAMLQNSTNTQLILTNVTIEHSGLYWVRVSEEMQEALPNTPESATNQNASAWLAVGAPYIEPLPIELSANEGSDFSFQATVVGSEPLSFQWRRNGVPIQDATNSTLFLHSVRLEDAGVYSLRATNPSGPADSTGLKLIVQPRYQLDQSQTDFGAWASMRDVNRNVTLAQTFTPAVSGRLMRLVISMHRGPSPTRLRIVDAPNGMPGTNVFGTVFLSGEEMEADFSEQPVFLNAGIPYAIEYWTDAPPADSVTYSVRTSASDVYAGGALWSRNQLTEGPWRRVTLFDDGVTGMDAVFETWMAPGLPECRITNPILGARVNEGATMTVSAECALDPSIAIVAVRFFVDEIEIGAATNAPYHVAWTATGTGEHLLKAAAEDSTGKLYTSAAVRIEVLPTSRPANDDFADRTILAGTYLHDVVDSSGATVEPEEPQPSTNSTGTLWWSWRAPDSRPVTITAQKSETADLSVTIYRGGMLESLLFVTNGTPECIFIPTTGETYAIAIGVGTNGDNVVLDIASADIELLEPTSGQATAPIEQRMRTSTSVARSITNVHFLTNGITLAEAAAVPAIITNRFNESGYYDLQIEARDERGIRTISRPVKFTVRPQNDSLSSPIAVTGYSGSVVGSTLAATRESRDPHFADNQGGRSIWYTWVAPASGICRLQGTGPGTGLILGAYIMKQGVLEMIAVNAMAPPGVPIEFQAVEGQNYHFWIDGYLGEEGVVQWSYSLRPGNDEFASRGLITGESFHQVFSIRGSKLDAGEPPLPFEEEPPAPPFPWTETGSVWWSWTAPLSGTVKVSLTVGESAAGISVYSGTALDALLLVDETMVTNSTVAIEFQATKGITYQLRVVGNSASTELLAVDLVVESLRIVNPLDASVHREPATILLEAHLQSGEALSSLRFQVNGEWLTNEVTNNGLLWEQVGPGTYTIVGSGRTESGTEFTSKPITVLVYKDDIVPQPRIFTGRFGYSSYVINAVGEVQVFGDRPTQFPSFSHADNFFPAVAFPPVGVKGWSQLASSWDGIWHFGLANDGRIFRKDGTTVPFPEGVSAWKALDIGFSTLVSIGDNGRAYANGVPIFDAPDGGGWVDYRIGQYQSLGLSGKGNIYGFWNNVFGQAQITEIEKPPGVSSWRKMDSALRSGLLLGDNGELYQLPMESSEGSFSPMLFQKPAGVTGWLKFCSGGFHHMAIGNNGALYTWGRNWEGQLGVGTTGNDRAIQMVPFPPGVTAWTEVAAGYMHSIAIGNDCSLYSWGPNYVGELGLGRQPLQSSPARVANVQNLCGTPILFLDGDRSLLEDGSFALRFDTVLNRTIVIQYSSDMQEWFTANGVVNGTGEPVTWIDDGPPKTRTHPREDGVRFYRFSFGQ